LAAERNSPESIVASTHDEISFLEDSQSTVGFHHLGAIHHLLSCGSEHPAFMSAPVHCDS